MLATTYPQEQLHYQYVIRPNRSISWAGTVALFAGVSLVIALIAILFTAKGAWLVLPFAGLEILALGTCLYICACRNAKCEVINIGENYVRVEKGRRQPGTQFQFQRAWARVRLNKSSVAWYPSRLTVCSMGREIEIGKCLIEEDREALARELQQKIITRDDFG